MGRDNISVRSERLMIRRWQRQDYHTMDRWPPFTEPLSIVWNLPDRVGREWKSDVRYTFAVQKHDGTLIGRITLRDIDRDVARLGITIGAPYVSQGYGTEAMRAFLNTYFSSMGFRTMVLDVAAVNERAVRCYCRLGFQHNGYHWRALSRSLLDKLDPESSRQIQPYLKQGQRSVWVQFYDMILHHHQWTTTLIELTSQEL